MLGIGVVQRPPQAPGLDAHAGIEARVEVGVPAEGLGGDGIGLDGRAVPGQFLLHDEAQEARELRRAQEGWRTQKDLQGLDHAADRNFLLGLEHRMAFPARPKTRSDPSHPATRGSRTHRTPIEYRDGAVRC
ncbi:hypothetical protein DK412_10805 [Methylobacterium sp. 17Sr1-1]|nr:hypothetical protein DK412_10805 [Methylobacterium sp. 17Sr1-1]